MSQRLDFSSISKIILENRTQYGFSYADYYYQLFEFAFSQTKYEIAVTDQANVNKIINGD